MPAREKLGRWCGGAFCGGLVSCLETQLNVWTCLESKHLPYFLVPLTVMEVRGKNSHLAMAIAWETVRIRWEIWLAAKSYGRVGIGRALPVFRTQAQDLHYCCWSMAMNWPFLTTCKTDQSYPGLFTFSNPPDALVTLHSTLLVGLDKWLKRRLQWWKGEKMHQFPAQCALLLHDQVLSGIWLQHNLIPYPKKTQLDSLPQKKHFPLLLQFSLFIL